MKAVFLIAPMGGLTVDVTSAGLFIPLSPSHLALLSGGTQPPIAIDREIANGAVFTGGEASSFGPDPRISPLASTTPGSRTSSQTEKIFVSRVDTSRRLDTDGEGSALARVRVRGREETTLTLGQVNLLADLASRRAVEFTGSDNVKQGHRFVQALKRLLPAREMDVEVGTRKGTGGRPGVTLRVALPSDLQIDICPYQSPMEEAQIRETERRDMAFQPPL